MNNWLSIIMYKTRKEFPDQKFEHVLDIPKEIYLLKYDHDNNVLYKILARYLNKHYLYPKLYLCDDNRYFVGLHLVSLNDSNVSSVTSVEILPLITEYNYSNSRFISSKCLDLYIHKHFSNIVHKHPKKEGV